ncbi:TIR domain-containing protein [Paraburkholderia sacchari]|uniref:TIR domain-containing protein n=1 Tax=Paraburkholderia sacchari TaxID=159450 RepID=UPI001FD3F767|nr:TIR domain-containing protein [Paraburkholderia sacchari]
MARKVFFSFKYDDVQRAMNVRNSNVLAGAIKSGFIDKAEFEKVERDGDRAIKNWIDKQRGVRCWHLGRNGTPRLLL